MLYRRVIHLFSSDYVYNDLFLVAQPITALIAPHTVEIKMCVAATPSAADALSDVGPRYPDEFHAK